MRNDEIKYCEKTGKYCYSSEAKATRALNRYEDIQRVYLCPECDYWHTTKIDAVLAIQEGLMEPKKKTYPTKTQIKRRLQKLIKKEGVRDSRIEKDESSAC